MSAIANITPAAEPWLVLQVRTKKRREEKKRLNVDSGLCHINLKALIGYMWTRWPIPSWQKRTRPKGKYNRRQWLTDRTSSVVSMSNGESQQHTKSDWERSMQHEVLDNDITQSQKAGKIMCIHWGTGAAERQLIGRPGSMKFVVFFQFFNMKYSYSASKKMNRSGGMRAWENARSEEPVWVLSVQHRLLYRVSNPWLNQTFERSYVR